MKTKFITVLFPTYSSILYELVKDAKSLEISEKCSRSDAYSILKMQKEKRLSSFAGKKTALECLEGMKLKKEVSILSILIS